MYYPEGDEDDEEGANSYTARVTFAEGVSAEGAIEAESEKEAQQRAAFQALKHLMYIPEHAPFENICELQFSLCSFEI